MKHTLKWIFFSLVFILSVNLSKAQLRNLGTPIKPGESHQNDEYAACNEGTELWVVYAVLDSSDFKIYLKIAKNNGLFWTEMHKQQISNKSGKSNFNAQWYNGDLYFNSVIGYSSTNAAERPNAIYKWNGSNVSLVDSFHGTLTDMDTFNGKLIVAGTSGFEVLSSPNPKLLAQYDGVNWSKVGNEPNWSNFLPGGYSIVGASFANAGNKIYINGITNIFNYNSSKPEYYGLAVYDGNSVNPIDTNEFNRTYAWEGRVMAHADSSSYIYSDSGMSSNYCRTGLKRLRINDPLKDHLNHPIRGNQFAYKGPSIFTLQASNKYVYYNTTAFIKVYTGRTVRKLILPDYLRLDVTRSLGMLGKNSVFFCMKNTRISNNFEGGLYQFFTLDSVENLSATLSGKAFLDLNNDCVFNGNDRPLKHHCITIQPGGLNAYTDDQGDYFIAGIDSGSYTASVTKDRNKFYSCPSSGQYSLLLNNDSNSIRNFAFKYDSSVLDLDVNLYANLGWRLRRQFSEGYQISVKNYSTMQRSGSVKVILDNDFYNISSSNSKLTFSGNVGTLTFTNLQPDQDLIINFSATMSSSVSLNSFRNMYAALDSVSTNWDNFPSNDKDTLVLKVLASFDPNDKTSLPAGDILPGTRHIQYHINFQNVGNDTAYNVVVVDTLDLRLPLEKIVIGSSSHKFQLRNVNNILIFEFKNIKLVDSATNEKGSKGFIRFSALLSPNLPIGSKVDNRAHIYFDYNEAVITNVASVRIQDKSEIVDQDITQFNKLLVYPNPSSNLIQIVNTLENSNYTIYNLNGETIQTGNAEMGENTINVSGLAKGIYFIVLSNGLNAKISIQ